MKRYPDRLLNAAPRTSAVRPRRRRNSTRTWWSDAERLAALAAVDANGGNVAAAARELGIPENTLRQWHKGERYPEAAQLRAEARGLLAAAMEDAVWQMLALAPGKLDAASLSQLSTAIGTLTDRMRLLRGEATTINHNANLNADVTGLVARMTPDERDQFRRLITTAAARPAPQSATPDGERPTTHEGRMD
jgi:hypothetical protein